MSNPVGKIYDIIGKHPEMLRKVTEEVAKREKFASGQVAHAAEVARTEVKYNVKGLYNVAKTRLTEWFARNTEGRPLSENELTSIDIIARRLANVVAEEVTNS